MARDQHARLEKEEAFVVYEGEATRTNDTTIQYHLIPQIILDVLGARFTLGAHHHGPHNWKQGGKDFILSCFARYEAHKSKLLYRPTEDDDIGAMMWNTCVLAWFKENRPEQFKAALEEMK